MNKPLIIYHYPCSDGISSAWVANKYFDTNCEFFKGQYGFPEPTAEQLKNRDVYLLDFSYKRDVIIKMAQHAKSIVIIDHHKSAQTELEDIDSVTIYKSNIICPIECHFDMTKSGAMLSWEYFFPEDCCPMFIGYVEDRDLWNWKLPQSQLVSAAIQSYPLTIDGVNEISKYTVKGLTEQGIAIQRFVNEEIVIHKERVYYALYNEHEIPIVNCSSKRLPSQLLNELCKNKYFAVSYFELADGRYEMSFRSDKDDPNAADVSEVAKKLSPTGGGHKNASGCTVDEIPLKRLEK